MATFVTYRRDNKGMCTLEIKTKCEKKGKK